MTVHVATNIWCQKSFKADIDAYHRHAKLLAKVGVILRMSQNKACLKEAARIGQNTPSESMLFLGILETAPSFFMAL